MPILSLERLQHVRSFLRAVLTWRIAMLAAMVLVVFAGGQRLLGTLFVSPGMVRQQIQDAVQRQTGLDLVVKGETSVSFWPSPVISLQNVDVIKPGAKADDAIFHADSISGRFDVVSALSGSPQFGSVVLTRPLLRVSRSTAGTFAWQEASGKHVDRGSGLDDLHLGRIRIVEGTFEFHQQEGLEAKFENVAGSLEFSSLSGSLSFDVSAKAADRPLSLSGSLAEPEKLMSGGNSALTVKLVSDDLDAGFSGTANIGELSFVTGSLEASAADLGAAATWIGLNYPVLEKLTVLDVKASLASEGMKFTFSDLSLQLPNYRATGIASVGWTKRGAPPFFSGTLAFDNFDAGAFVTAFVPSALNLREMPLKFDTSFLRDFQVDLRLSASKATFGAVTVADMAAGVRIVDGHASFAIASGQLANGNLSAEVSVDDDPLKGPLCKLLVQARNIDLGAVPGIVGLSGPWPQASGNLEVDLRSRLPLSASGRTETNGAIKLSGGAGKLIGFDPAVFRELASQKRFFDLSLASATPLRFDSFQMAAVVDNGIAELNTASFKSASGNLDLTGVIPYKNNSLAVSGTLGAPAGSTAPATRFFAGGAWPNILISPFSAILSGQ